LQRCRFFGVIEGFYRKPYTFNQRFDLVRFLSRCGLNTYVYGPKADTYHRKTWQKQYPARIFRQFEKLVKLSKKHSIFFNYALSPMSRPDTEKIIRKITTMLRIGVEHFSIFYDDIKVPLTRETAEIQTRTANELLKYLKRNISRPILFFCPTQYRGFEETEYIKTVAKRLHKDIYIFWTGKRVVSRRITEKDINSIKKIIDRPPLIWDNLYANDYIPGMIWRFPYRYRAPGIVKKVSGILTNPMNQYEKSKPLIYTMAKFINNPYDYVPQKAWKETQQIES